MDSYTANLEGKVRSGQAGLIIDLFSGVNVGLAYDCNKNNTKEYIGVQFNSAIGSVKSKAESEGLSAIVTLNPDNAGLTGNLVGYYSWGKVKNTRTITHGENEIHAKGNPNITLTGSLIQVGYNFPVLKTLTITPYVECMMSVVKWSPYQEKHTPFPCEISKNREYFLEKSIGLRNQWEINRKS